jgi:glucose-1-phosphate adenylyltransferase
VFSHAFVDILAEQTQIIQLGFKEHPMQCANVCLTFESFFDYALILSGDQLYQMDFNEMIEEHIKSSGYHIATLPVNKKALVWDFKTNAGSCIESFIEKPAKELLRMEVRCK